MRQPGSLLFSLLIVALFTVATARAQAPVVTNDAAMEADVLRIMAQRDIPGTQVAIISADGSTWQQSFGVRDLATAAPMAADTLLQAGSVTKVFTASLLADLVSEQKLAWSDTLADRLPGIPLRRDLAGITLEELATHTARLPANPPNRVDRDGVMQPYSNKELLASLVDQDFKLGEPGRTYSNWGYALLGLVIERAAGKPYEDVLRERIFAPLHMTDSRIELSAAEERRLAAHYWPEDKPHIARPRWVFGEVAAFGGITSKASDLARFLRYQMDPLAFPDVLDADAVLSMRAVRTLGASWQIGGGRGWLVVRDSDGSVTYEHSGEVDGHSSYLGFSADNRVGVVVMANLGGNNARAVALPLLARAVAQARQQQPVDKEKALLLARKRQWADAEPALSRLVVVEPDNGQAWHQLGLVRYELHDLAGAEAAFEHAATKSEKPAASQLMLTVIAASQGRPDRAFEWMRRIGPAERESLDFERIELRSLRSDPRWLEVVGRAGSP